MASSRCAWQRDVVRECRVRVAPGPIDRRLRRQMQDQVRADSRDHAIDEGVIAQVAHSASPRQEHRHPWQADGRYRVTAAPAWPAR